MAWSLHFAAASPNSNKAWVFSISAVTKSCHISSTLPQSPEFGLLISSN